MYTYNSFLAMVHPQEMGIPWFSIGRGVLRLKKTKHKGKNAYILGKHQAYTLNNHNGKLCPFHVHHDISCYIYICI